MNIELSCTELICVLATMEKYISSQYHFVPPDVMEVFEKLLLVCGDECYSECLRRINREI